MAGIVDNKEIVGTTVLTNMASDCGMEVDLWLLRSYS